MYKITSIKLSELSYIGFNYDFRIHGEKYKPINISHVYICVSDSAALFLNVFIKKLFRLWMANVCKRLKKILSGSRFWNTLVLLI